MSSFIDVDDISESSDIIDNCVQLGFINKIDNNSNNSEDDEIKKNDGIFHSSDWSVWDGGIVGGKPCWLNPVKPLSYDDIICNECEEPMIHLLHLYCPLDDPKHAFHRTLYLFCCKNSLCITSGNVKCFRYQLPRNNPYFPYNSEDGAIIDNNYTTKDEMNKSHPYHSKIAQLCVVCGCKGDKKCSGCGEMYYCSRAHQKFHWKIGRHNKLCGGNCNDNNINESVESTVDTKETKNEILFPQYEIMVMEEELDEKLATPTDIPLLASKSTEVDASPDEDDDDKAIREEFEKVARRAGQDVPKNTYEDDEDEGRGDGEDKIYQEFTKRVRMGGAAQVLRYTRWNPHGHLLMHRQAYNNITNSNNKYTVDNVEAKEVQTKMKIEIDKVASVPCCENCGGPRQIEFQVMPQLIHFIDKKEGTRSSNNDSKEDKEKLMKEVGIDWGTLDVWTCTNSCNTSAQGEDIGNNNNDNDNNNGNHKAFLTEVVTIQKPLPHARSNTTASASASQHRVDPNQHVLT